ncbi:MAG: hypothetical protein QOG85_1623 [Gaiellaceae bacterium]|jgi:hypothetical protein|nr:hypothetical protein [Gaiellaceae bacterium]
MIRIAALAVAALFAVGYSGDLALVHDQLPRIHPHVDVQAFDAAAAQLGQELPGMTETQADVGFMKLAASLGDRNGHTGIFPLDPGNDRDFHEYPYLVYEFMDGVYVTGQIGGHGLVGARLTAVGGVSIEDVLAEVEPLVPADNRTTGPKNLRFMYLLSQEVLDGLGIAPQFDFTLRDGQQVERSPAPVSAGAYSAAFQGIGPAMWPNGPRHAADRAAETRVSLLAGGRVVYLAYNTTTVYMNGIAAQITKLARSPKVRRIVIDLRNNRGGDNRTYAPLVTALKRLAYQHKQIAVLAGRATFSAAANFMGDLEAATRYLLVGEDSGGAPNLYGDVQPLDLPATGLRIEVATIWWVKSKLGADDPRVTFHPDVVMPPSAKSWFAGRDIALHAALTAPFSLAHAVH